MLPFESNTKKYVCFCCGLILDEFKDYKSHIVETHEEGREFIKCPLFHCGAPVRDIRSHFKVYHPSEQMPNNIQMRVMVWRDFGTKKRKKLKFEEGFLVSTKNHGRSMHYRSSYERQVYECLEDMVHVSGYYVEPFKVPYIFRGKHKHYFPDLKVDFSDGHIEIWEIKPKKQTSLEQNRAKWSACRQLCAANGWMFVVKTEQDINNLIVEAGNQ